MAARNWLQNDKNLHGAHFDSPQNTMFDIWQCEIINITSYNVCVDASIMCVPLLI